MIKVLEILTSIVFNLSFPNRTLLSCFFFFLLKLIYIFLVPAVIAQVFIPTAELVIPTGTQTNEANVEIETQLVTAETKISKFLT